MKGSSSDQNVVVTVVKLFIFSSSPEPLGHIFNQIWHKAPLGKGDSSFYIEGLGLFSKGHSSNIVKILNQTWYKSFLADDSPFSKGQ